MTDLKTICVFCGSGTGKDPLYPEKALELADLFLKKGIALVYGGANVGLMRVLADAMLAGGGRVTGVMPRSLVEREVAHFGLTEMHIVEGMQERKALMAELSDAFIAMPGAFGTLDELFEMLSWNQLGIIRKPVGLLNVKSFWDPLLEMLDHAMREQFLRPEHRALLVSSDDPAILLEELEKHRPQQADKWIERLKEGKI